MKTGVSHPATDRSSISEDRSVSMPRVNVSQPPDAAQARDGRVRRGERSRQAIVAAMFELIGEGVLQPTAQQVADRAGVGIRSVFRHFSEMESLYAAMDARLEGEARRVITGVAPSGGLNERVAGLLRQRIALFESIAPYKRAANLQRWRSSFLQDRHLRMQRLLAANLREWLPELGGAPVDLVEALDLVTSFEAWDRLRGDRQVGPKIASAVLERLVTALLAGADLGAA